MDYTVSWGCIELPKHDAGKTQIDFMPITQSRRMLDGTLRVNKLPSKRRITMSWSALTEDEYQVIREAFVTNAFTPTVLTMPETVWPDEDDPIVMAPNGMRMYVEWGGKNSDVAYYFVTIVFSEV